MACTFAFVVALALAAPADAVTAGYRNIRKTGRGMGSERVFLATGMVPEVVAQTLLKVEEEWKAQAAVFLDCSGINRGGDAVVDCSGDQQSFSKSCSMVVSAVVQASKGDQDVVKEYMADVCKQKLLSGWRKNGCFDLAAAVKKTMTADNYVNRNDFDASQPCNAVWTRFLETEKERAAKEMAERKEAAKRAEEEAKKQAEEAAKKAKEEAEAEAKAEAERQKIQAERKKAEEVARKKKEAEEAAKRVEEAAKRVAEKQAEAEAVAKAAKEKMEEAARVEKEHQELLAKAKLGQGSAPLLAAANATNATVKDTANASQPEVTPSTPMPPAARNSTVPEATEKMPLAKSANVMSK